MVRIQNIKDYTIFQQEEGTAEIKVICHLDPDDAATPEDDVYASLWREENGYALRLWQKAEKVGEEYICVFSQVPAGGLYTLQTASQAGGFSIEECHRGEAAVHLGVGDLFVIAGQSNSAGFARTPGFGAPELGVHLYRNSCRWDVAFHPMNDSANTGHPENREFGISGQSPYLSFAKFLKRELNYPIGLIQCSVGGSSLACWNPEENGILYRMMVKTVASAGGKVKGVLWYQGESDSFTDDETDSYAKRFRTFLKTLRRNLGCEVPIITVQLNQFLSNTDAEEDRRWASVRETQRRLARTENGVFVVPSIDLTLSDEIHNNSISNELLGTRMAVAALDSIYHRNYYGKSPDLEKAEINGDIVTLTFSHVETYLVLHGLPPERSNFAFSDDKGKLSFTSFGSSDNKIHFTLSRKAEGPLFVSYAPCCCAPAPVPFDRATGLPLLAFYRIPVIERIFKYE